MKRTWANGQEELLKKGYPTATSDRIRELFTNKSAGSIKSKLKSLGLKKSIQRFRFTIEQVEEIKRDYATTLNRDLAKRIGCPIYSIENKGYHLKLKKDLEFVRQVAKDNFKEDHPAKT